jgi:hypothetical protein
MDEQFEYGFGTAIFVLDHTAGKHTPEEAERNFGDLTKENFWRMWPHVREWADSLWHQIEDERGHQSRPALDEELDDVGGGG